MQPLNHGTRFAALIFAALALPVSAAEFPSGTGDANPLPGVKRGTLLVFQLVPHFPRQRPAFGSVSTADPDGLTAFVNPGLSAANLERALVRQGAGGSVEIAFPGPYGTPDSFDEYPVRVRISNATAR